MVLPDHEDHQHNNLKNWVSQLCSQPDSEADAANLHLLLSKAHMMSIAAADPGLDHVTSTLSKTSDCQSVPMAEALVFDELLQRRLAAAGHVQDALVLRVLGHAQQAWDQGSHFNFAQRTYRLQNLHALVRQLVLPLLDDLGSMSVFASQPVKVLGVTTELLFVLLANVEARESLMRQCPGATLLNV